MTGSKMDVTETALGEIVHNADSRDHFDVLGLPRRLQINQADLAKHYYALSRLYHPDFHQASTPSERVAFLRRSAAVNDAYKTLKDPIARGRWWLEANGRRLSQNNQVPPDLIELVFEVQDALSEFAERGDQERSEQIARHREAVQRELSQRNAELAENFARWDERSDGDDEAELLDELQRVLASISYTRNVLRDIDAARENVHS